MEENTLCIMSPRLKTVQVALDALGIDTLEFPEDATFGMLIQRASDAILERLEFERWEEGNLRKTADERKKQWIADLPEYQQYLERLKERYPIGKDVAWMKLSIEEMKLILKISTL